MPCLLPGSIQVLHLLLLHDVNQRRKGRPLCVCVCACVPSSNQANFKQQTHTGPKQNQHHKAAEAEAATITSALLVLTLATHAFAVCVLVSLFALSLFISRALWRFCSLMYYHVIFTLLCLSLNYTLTFVTKLQGVESLTRSFCGCC